MDKENNHQFRINRLARFPEMQIRSLESIEGIDFVEFYACIYNVKYPIFIDSDKINEMILPDAFKEWLSTPEGFDRVVHLLDHDETCGLVKDIYSDEKGLIIRSALLSNQNNEAGDTAKSHYVTAQKINKTVKHSIGFQPFDREQMTDYYYDRNLDCYILKRGKLYDVTTVTKWAANPKAIDLQRIANFSESEKIENTENNWNFLKSF